MNKITHTELIKRTEDIDDLYKKVKLFDIDSSQFIEQINKTSDVADQIGPIALVDKLESLKETINKIVKVHSLHEDVLPSQEIIEITRTNEFDMDMHIFQGFVSQSDTIIKSMETSKKSKNFTDSVIASITNLTRKTEDFKKKLIAKISTLDEKIKMANDDSSDIFNSTDIFIETKNVYNYAKRITGLEKKQPTVIKPLKIKSASELLINIAKSMSTNDSLILRPHLITDYINVEQIYLDVIAIEPSDLNHEMIGGLYENADSQTKLFKKLQNMSDTIFQTNSIMSEYIDKQTKVKLLEIQKNNYFIYLILVNTPNNLNNSMVYHHINKGLIQFYLSIVESILEQGKTGSKKKYVVYFIQNHSIILNKLQKFLRFLVFILKPLQVINIDRCEGNIKKNFFLLNCFKDILDSYHEILQSKVAIYARINDWGSQPVNNVVFSQNTENARILRVNGRECSESGNVSNIKFTEVFDTENFKTNANITKYMTLETQLSKKKGVMLMTYGYSGTGKTFTLFGSSTKLSDKQAGLLQATLNNIVGLSEVRFRVFELYGKGVQYPHYWNSKNIYQYVFTYPLEIDNNKIKIDKDFPNGKMTANVIQFCKNLELNFIKINEKNVEQVFSSFDDFIGNLDLVRRNSGRIKTTPNNPESSRSIVIYEFHLLIENVYVPFVIVDLPGREEIVQTYCNDYLQKPFIPEELKDDFHVALLSSMCINPLALSILTPSVIFKTFNSLDGATRKKIVTTHMLTDIPGNDDDNGDEDENEEIVFEEFDDNGVVSNAVVTKSDDIRGSMFENEYFTRTKKGKDKELSYIYDFNNKNWKHGYKFNIINSKVKINDNALNRDQIPTNVNSIQYEGALAIHLMNRLIVQKEFDIIELICKNIIDEYFGIDMSKPVQEKKIWLKNVSGDSMIDTYSDEKINMLFDHAVHFRIPSAPAEGIYINENIVGLIKVLARDVLEKSDDYILENLMKEQDKSLNFADQKKTIRDINKRLYKEIGSSSEQYENVFRINLELKKIIDDNNKIYSSQKIYNYENPSIESIIKIYFKKRSSDKIPIIVEPITDFKLFYLFTNTEKDKKCEHQIKLLNNTLAFINATDNN